MDQVWITRAGGPQVLSVRSAPDPQCGPEDVLIDVVAAGVNFADLMARMGQYPDAPPIPCVVGYEISGTVRACGAAVESVKPGSRVLALTRFGGYSTVAAVPHAQVYPIPDVLSFHEAAAIPVNYFTAYLALFTMGALKRGQRCLIQNAGGGVGIAAAQLARWAGAEIFGTASASKHEVITAQGVDHAVDYRHLEFDDEVMRLTGGRGVHLILDPVGGTTTRRGYRCLAPLGKIVCYGISSSVRKQRRSIFSLLSTVLAMPRPHPVSLMNENRGILGLNLGHLWSEIPALTSVASHVLSLCESGDVKPVVAKTFPFTEAPEAHRFIHERRNIGKVLLTTD